MTKPSGEFLMLVGRPAESNRVRRSCEASYAAKDRWLHAPIHESSRNSPGPLPSRPTARTRRPRESKKRMVPVVPSPIARVLSLPDKRARNNPELLGGVLRLSTDQPNGWTNELPVSGHLAIKRTRHYVANRQNGKRREPAKRRAESALHGTATPVVLRKSYDVSNASYSAPLLKHSPRSHARMMRTHDPNLKSSRCSCSIKLGPTPPSRSHTHLKSGVWHTVEYRSYIQ